MHKLENFYKQASSIKRLALALVIFALSLGVRFAVFSEDNGPPFITFYPALICVFYLCGTVLGSLVVLLGVLASTYFFIPPYYSFSLTESGITAEAIFISTSGLIGLAIHRLQFSQSLYYDILQDQLEFICRFKPDGTFIYVNDAYCRYFSRSRQDLIGKQWHPQAHPGDLDKINQRLSLLTKDNPVLTIENRLILLDGSIRWGQFINRGFFDAKGRLVEIQSVGRDVTAQKEFEQALQNERNKFQSLIHNASDGIHVLNFDGYIIEASDSFCNMLGYSRDEVIGMHVDQWDTGFSGFEEKMAVLRQQFERTQRSQFETRHQCKDGHVIDVEVSGIPLVMDGQTVLFNSSRDITARKKSEQALLEITERLEVAASAGIVGVWDWDIVNNRLIWDRVMCKLYGVDETDENVGAYDTWVQCLHPEDKSYTEDVLQAALQDLRPYALEFRIIRPDGEIRYLKGLAHITFNEQGEPVRMVGVNYDITEQKNIELRLERIVADRTIELVDSKRYLQRAQEIAHLGSWQYDLATNQLTWSDEVFRIYGMAPQSIAPTYEGFFAQVHPGDRERVHRTYSESITSKCEDYEVEHRILRKDNGQTRIVYQKCEHFRDSSGAIIRSEGTVLDITKLKATEDQLRTSQAQLSLFISNAPAALAMFDRNMNYLFVSQRWCKDYNLSEDEIIGRSHYTVFPDLPERWKSIHRRGLSGETIVANEDIFIRSDASMQYLRWEVRPWFEKDGVVGGIIIFFEDITDRKQLEHELERHRQHLETLVDERTAALALAKKQTEQALLHFQTLFEQSPLGIVLYNAADGQIMEVNQRFADIVGRSRDELLHIDWPSITHPDDRENNLSQVSQLNGDSVSSIHLEKRYLKPDNSIVWVSVTVARLLTEVGNRPVNLAMVEDISVRKHLELAYAESQERFRLMADSAPVLIWISGVDDEYVWFNKVWLNFTGRSLDQEQGNGWHDGVHPDDLDLCIIKHRQHIEFRQPFTMEYRLKRQDGEYRWLTDSGIPLFDESGQFTGFIGSCVDITERKIYENRLELSARVFTHAREAIAITDAKGVAIEVNNTFVAITGYSANDAQGQILCVLHSSLHPPEFFANIWSELYTKGYWSGEIWAHRENGDTFAAIVTISSVLDIHGRVQNYVVLFSDITRLKEHQRQLEYAAHFDALTKLPNRILLADRLNQEIAQVQRRKCSLAVIFLDLDGFKSVNDQYGHDAGDELLITVSQRMAAVLREGDTLARIGGDEFVAVAIDLNGIEDCEPILVRLLQAASTPVPWRDAILEVSASIGITFYPQDNVEADQLMRHADQAMYIAKQQGKNRYHIFDITLAQSAQSLCEQIDRFGAAFDKDELVLFYQPKICLKSRKVVGAEALIRWQHPEHGLLTPDQFLPLIEEHPLSVKLDSWVIGQALKQLRLWQSQGLKMRVSVNIGALLLQGDQFVQLLAEELDRNSEIEPNCLELEILESRALNNIDHVVTVMHSCRQFGVRFALDDFGTGYCSLTYLKHLPADVLKIDRSFVRDMLDDPDDLAIVNGIIGLAQAFDREVVAEGVETQEHCDRLLELGCRYGQGYGLAYPMERGEFSNWVLNFERNDT